MCSRFCSTPDFNGSGRLGERQLFNNLDCQCAGLRRPPARRLLSACTSSAAARLQLRAWCSTAAHEHAMLEVRVRIPAPAPSSSASACRRCCPVLPDEDSMHLWGSGLTHLAVNEAPKRLRTFKSLPDAPTHWAMHKSAAVPCKHSRRRALLRWSTTRWPRARVSRASDS